MLTLAIENSSPQTSLALMRDETVLAERQHVHDRRGQEQIFELLDQLLHEANEECAAIERYVVGRGPGNYTGMRIGITMAQALALPGEDEVLAVSSGAALALETMRNEKFERVAIAGDARRGQYWMGIFRLENGILRTEKDWSLYSGQEFVEALPEAVCVTSSEMDRLQERQPCTEWNRINWIEGNRHPIATFLAEIASGRIHRGEAMEPVEPLYMHPAL